MATLTGLTPEFRSVLAVFFRLLREHATGVRWTVTSAYRSSAAQAALYRKLAPRGMAVAPPGRSKHERGRAIDIVFYPADFAPVAGEAWEALGGRWGGRFKKYDPVHFEDPYPL